MGTYHFLDGAKVKIFYRGNTRTCGRCHCSSFNCPGKGIAKDCQSAGGQKVFLNDHMKRLWALIGFNPTNFELDNSVTDLNDMPIGETEAAGVTPVSSVSKEVESDRHIGLSIANISLEKTNQDILDFVRMYVDKNIKDKDIDIVRDKKKAVATISNSLSSDVIKGAMSQINFSQCKKKFFGLPLYCRPLRNLTPEKAPAPSSIPGLSSKKLQKAPSGKNDLDDFKNGNDTSRSILQKRSEKGPNSDQINGTTPKKSLLHKTDAFEVLMCAAKSNSPTGQNGTKRGSDQLSSPCSPPNLSEIKKSKSGTHQESPQK